MSARRARSSASRPGSSWTRGSSRRSPGTARASPPSPEPGAGARHRRPRLPRRGRLGRGGRGRGGGREPVALGRADGDLAEAGVAERLLAAHQPDVVVHLAAVMPGDERLAENPPITALVAAGCAARRIPVFHGSTTSVYADETPYAESKRASEEAAGDATLLRFHFPYGPEQRRGAIPTMLR